MANKNKKAKSRVIAARLNLENEREKTALEIFDKKRKSHSAREIITDAILRASGYTPEMFDSGDEKITQGQLVRTLEDFAHYIIEQIQSSGIAVKPVQKEDSSPFDDSEEDTDVMKNMAAGYLNRRKRG